MCKVGGIQCDDCMDLVCEAHAVDCDNCGADLCQDCKDRQNGLCEACGDAAEDEEADDAAHD